MAIHNSKNMKKILILIIFIFQLICCSGQKPDTVDLRRISKEHRKIPNNSIFFELGGQAMLVSIDYERIIFHGSDFYMSGRTGIGCVPGTISTLSLPLLFNGMYQVSNGFLFELGLGFNLTYTFYPDYYSSDGFLSGNTFHKSGRFFDPLITGVVGFRVQGKKGFLFRLGFTPFIELTKNIENRTIYKQVGTKNSFLPWVGMSFGYCFKVKK